MLAGRQAGTVPQPTVMRFFIVQCLDPASSAECAFLFRARVFPHHGTNSLCAQSSAIYKRLIGEGEAERSRGARFLI
jgi:hypothetical protein